MFDRIRTWVLHVLRVPHEPAPPLGAPGSVRVFRAGRNYLNLRLFRWGLGQFVGVIGICFSILFLNWLDIGAPRFQAMLAEQKAARPATPAGAGPVTPADTPASAATAPATPPPKAAKPGPRRDPNAAIRTNLLRMAAQSSWVLPLLHFFEYLAILTFLAQIPVSLAIVRLEFELHWYIVTDRSLRIRTGVLSLQESTMSFANLQQVEVKQGPLQRLLGLADVHVQSAGGGDRDPRHGRAGDSLHTGIFHSVDNATEIRDLILARLRQFRQAGLGDPEDHHDHPAVMPPASPTDALAATQEILTEARALRQALS